MKKSRFIEILNSLASALEGTNPTGDKPYRYYITTTANEVFPADALVWYGAFLSEGVIDHWINYGLPEEGVHLTTAEGLFLKDAFMQLPSRALWTIEDSSGNVISSEIDLNDRPEFENVMKTVHAMTDEQRSYLSFTGLPLGEYQFTAFTPIPIGYQGGTMSLAVGVLATDTLVFDSEDTSTSDDTKASIMLALLAGFILLS